jgi:hypothetical protein
MRVLMVGAIGWHARLVLPELEATRRHGAGIGAQ